MMSEAELNRWATAEAARLKMEREILDSGRIASPVRPAVLVRGASEIVTLARELKRLGVKHFKDDSMELSFERETKRPERPEGEF